MDDLAGMVQRSLESSGEDVAVEEHGGQLIITTGGQE